MNWTIYLQIRTIIFFGIFIFLGIFFQGYLLILCVPMCILSTVAFLSTIPAPFIQPTYNPKFDILLSEEDENELLKSNKPLNSFQIIGTHNSCHKTNVFAFLFIHAWCYNHYSLTSQLEMGIRHLEIDVWFNRSTKKWEVFHESIDALSVAPFLFINALSEIHEWCNKYSNYQHFPLIINIDIKGAYKSNLSFLYPSLLGRSLSKKDSIVFQYLENEILSVFQSKQIFGPKTMITSNSLQDNTLPLKLLLKDITWPSPKELKGKVIFMLNIYQDRAECIDAANNRNIFFTRGSIEDPRCVYIENYDSHDSVLNFHNENGLVRSSAFVCSFHPFFSQKKKDILIQQGEEKMKHINFLKLNLVATNHPTKVCEKSIIQLDN
eukprot:c7059_g1_i1.p1 GENE.c7059_g1_i1~~c7059_g1_i1.p1  ORF type:complete len:390 (+),score=114.90 c7059_g1_i1:36-1172(+)